MKLKCKLVVVYFIYGYLDYVGVVKELVEYYNVEIIGLYIDD